MGESSSVQISNLKRKKDQKFTFIHQLLDSLPYPALIIDSNSWKVLDVNAAASRLIEVPVEELLQLELFSLLSNWNSEFMELISSSKRLDRSRVNTPIQVELSRREKSKINIELQFSPIQGYENQALIFLEPMQAGPAETQPDILQLLKGLEAFSKISNISDMETSLKTALEAASMVTGSNILAIYLAHEGMPVFQRFIVNGDAKLLPEQLSDIDFEGLKETDLWIYAKRPSSALHRIARVSGFSYFGTHILGDKNAIIGLLVIADQKKSPAGSLVEIIGFFGSLITAIIQIHSRKNHLFANLEELRQQNIVLKNLVGTIEEAAVVIDPEYRVQELNSAAETIFGYSSREAKGQSIDTILIGEPPFITFSKSTINNGVTENSDTIYLFRRNGEKFLATMRFVPVIVDGQSQAVVIVVQDLSAQEEIRNRAQLYEQRATLGEVTALFTHEMRNMINNISTTLQLMQRQVLKDETHRNYIDQMLEECDRLSEQVSAVLAIAKPQKYELITLDLSVLLRLLLERFKARILKAKVDCELIVLPECPLVEGNQYALEEAFGNLISNALDAMDETGGRLVLRLQPVLSQEGKSFLQVAVADTGPGIPPEFRDRIFQHFFTTKQKGTGLGLPIIKGIITSHKGNIRVEYYTPGTVFYIQLPASKKKEEFS